MATRRPRQSTAYQRATPNQLMWRRLRPVLIGLGVLLVAVIAYYTVDGAKLKTRLANAAANYGYVVHHTDIEGIKQTSLDAVNVKLAIPKNAPLFSLNLPQLREQVLTLPWVREATLKRQWPNRLIVTITERVPVALYKQAGDKIALVDTTGAVLATENLKSYGRFLLVEGDEADVKAGDLIAKLANYPTLAVQLKKAVRVSKRRWDLVLEATDIKLPEDDKLAEALAKIETENLLKGEKAPKTVDLRLLDKPKITF